MSQYIHLKMDQAARLRAALAHLSDEDFVNRAFDDVSAEDNGEYSGEYTAKDRARIDAHVTSCEACREELDRTRELTADMNTRERSEQVDRLWAGFLSAAGTQHWLSGLLKAFGQIVSPVPRLATRGGPLLTRGAPSPGPTTGRVVAEGSAVDEHLRWRFTEEESGDLRGLIVCSDVEPLRGASVSLNTSPPRSAVLAEVDGKLQAEFVISRADWRRMPRGPMIDRIVLADGEVLTPDGAA